jgi:beta-carotene 3-hydroxylase
MNVVVVGLLAFIVMEPVTYAVHRWVMHGFALGWHRSHHAPPSGRFERNDLFPVCFSAVGVTLFALAGAGVSLLWPVAIGVTAYGAAYLFVHDVFIHHRLPVRLPPLAYLTWLRDAHADHHATGAEPYGMLLPLVRSERSGSPSRRDVLDRVRSETARARL